jgi:hypothetical protein
VRKKTNPLLKMSRIITFQLTGRIPSKKNNKSIRFNRKTRKPFITSSDDYKKWHGYASLQINTQKTDIKNIKFPIQKCEYIEVTLFYGTKHRSDNTNKTESVHDLLVDMGVLQDDNWQITGRTTQIPIYREKEPGAEIVIGIRE